MDAVLNQEKVNKETIESHLSAPTDSKKKKLFVKPQLKQHGTLPQVTGAFVGSFDP